MGTMPEITILVFSLGIYGSLAKFYQNERELVADLLKDYDATVRPVRDYMNSLNISITAKLRKLEKLDERNEELHTNLLIYMQWPDDFLGWDKKMTKGITITSLPAERIWTPQLELVNSMGQNTADAMSLKGEHLLVLSNGNVVSSMFRRLQTSCSVNLRKFPFDTQTCKIVLNTGMTTSYYRLQKIPQGFLSYVKSDANNEWSYVEVTRSIDPQVLTGFSVDQLQLTLTMTRNPTFYVFYLLLPAVIMAFVSTLVFFLPPESGERVGLSITLLLSYTVLLLMVSDTVPRGGNNTSLLVIYITLMECLATVILTASVIILRLSHRGSHHPVPPLLKKLVTHSKNKRVEIQPSESLKNTGTNGRNETNDWIIISRVLDFYFGVACICVTLLSTIVVFGMLLFNN